MQKELLMQLTHEETLSYIDYLEHLVAAQSELDNAQVEITNALQNLYNSKCNLTDKYNAVINNSNNIEQFNLIMTSKYSTHKSSVDADAIAIEEVE